MHVTGTFNEISSAVSVMTLDQRLLMALVLGASCAAIQAVIFPPSRLSTGVAQITPSVALVSIVNELFFNSESWPFGAPLPSLHSLSAAFNVTPLRFLSLFYSAMAFGFVLPFIPRICQVYIFFAVQAVVYALLAIWVAGFAPHGLRAFILEFFSLDAADHLIPVTPAPSSSKPLVSLLRSAISHSTISVSRIGEFVQPPPQDDSLAATCISIVISGGLILFALWLLKRKNVLLLSLANVLRYTDTCFICAFAMAIMFTRATAAVVSVGSHMQPAASIFSGLRFHIGSLYLAAHLSIVDIAAIVELILYPTFMSWRVTLQPLPALPSAASAPTTTSTSTRNMNDTE